MKKKFKNNKKGFNKNYNKENMNPNKKNFSKSNGNVKKEKFKKVEGESLSEMCKNIKDTETLPEGKRETSYPNPADGKINYQEAMKKEIWVPMYGFEETHMISSMGRVKSKQRYMTDKNGNNRFVRGTIYKIPDDSQQVVFSVDGKTHNVSIPNVLGKSFYNPAEDYSLINSYESFVKEDRQEMYVSLSNICSNRARKITIFNKKTKEENLITGGGLLMLIKYLNDTYLDRRPEGSGRFVQEDLLHASTFKVDDDLGLIISGVNYIPEIEIIVRRGSAYNILIETKEKYNILDNGLILDEKYIGLIWTGREIRYGLVKVMENNAILYRFALGLLNRYFNKCEYPLNEKDNYIIISKISETDGVRRFSVCSYFKLCRYKEFTLTGLPKSTVDKIMKDRKISKKYEPEELVEVAKLKLAIKKNKNVHINKGEKKD